MWTLIATATTAVVCGGGWQLLLSNLGARFVHSYIAEFDEMPADDSELGIWLGQQQNVGSDSIVIFRERKSLTVHFAIDQNLRGEPKTPDLDSKCKSLVYLGANAQFRFRDGPIVFPSDAWNSRDHKQP
jgi:hypothetical protein